MPFFFVVHMRGNEGVYQPHGMRMASCETWMELIEEVKTFIAEVIVGDDDFEVDIRSTVEMQTALDENLEGRPWGILMNDGDYLGVY